MQTIFDLPDSIKDDLDRFMEQTKSFKDGSVSAIEFRSFRVPQGVYEQREEGTYMLRVRFPAGGVLPHHMRALASVARRYGNGILHATTRQDIQVHRVLLDNIHPALVELHGAGLSTKGGGGNTVRNITACYDAGVCAREAFDVSPYAVALTEFLLPDPLSFQLPRKYKIAFSGCSRDCAGAMVNDLGFVATTRDGSPGFIVYVGGGMGAYSRVADLLEEFVPADDAHFVAEAIKRVFDRHGNRKNKHKARLRFLIDQIGLRRFRALYEAELSELRSAELPPLRLRNLPARSRPAPAEAAQPLDAYDEWSDRSLLPQKQEGYRIVLIPLLLGDIEADRLEKLAYVVEDHGEGMVRTTQGQNLAMRWVHENELAGLHQKLLALNLAKTCAPIVRNTIACAGASTCKLGICLSRGLARAITDRLSGNGLDLAALGDFSVHISGCPNSCGRHPLGRIGLFGAARRIGGRLVPHYVVQLGSKTGAGQTRLAEGRDAIPARNVPAFVVELLRAFAGSEQYPDYDAFLEAQGRETVAQLCRKYKPVPSFDEDKDYYFDWGAESLFSLAGRGPGECGAGVFDLIEVDLASAHDALSEGRLYAASLLAARALLVTRGQEAGDDAEAFDLFRRHFVDAGLLDESHGAVLGTARQCASSHEPECAFDAQGPEVSSLVDAVQELYEGMDSSLRFKPAAQQGAQQAEVPPRSEVTGQQETKIDREVDFRGVACPLNYAKTKLVLEQMASGEVLSVLMGEEGARNVPQSAEQDGHEVLSVTPEEEAWRVTIRKT